MGRSHSHTKRLPKSRLVPASLFPVVKMRWPAGRPLHFQVGLFAGRPPRRAAVPDNEEQHQRSRAWLRLPFVALISCSTSWSVRCFRSLPE
jgi:hypothetical protein